MEIRKLSEEATELDFEPIHEGWNEYDLVDGSRMRIRPIVFKVFDTHQLKISGGPLIAYAATNVTSVRVSKEAKSLALSEEEGIEETRTMVDFEPVKEVWNTHRLENGDILKVRLIVSRVVRSSRINQFQEPVYVVSSTNVSDVSSSSRIPD